MSYTYDITTDIGKIRLRINDKPNDPTQASQFTDDELQIFLTDAGNVNLAAAQALEAWAAALSDSATSEKIGDYSYSKASAANKLAMADKLRAVDGAVPVFDWAEFNLTGDVDE